MISPTFTRFVDEWDSCEGEFDAWAVTGPEVALDWWVKG
jgi:hypothetical protein